MTAILKEDPPPLLPTTCRRRSRASSRAVSRKRARCGFSRRAIWRSAWKCCRRPPRPRAPPPAPSAVRSAAPRALRGLAAGAFVIGLAGAIAWNLRRPAPPLPVTRFALALPAGQLLNGNGGGHSLALSPDGARLAYLASRLYVRSMSELDVKAMPGTERYVGVREPVFSPDGASIAFYALADQTLKRATVTGDTVTTICPADNPTGITLGAGRHRLRPGTQGHHARLRRWRHAGGARARQGR